MVIAIVLIAIFGVLAIVAIGVIVYLVGVGVVLAPTISTRSSSTPGGAGRCWPG